MSFTPGPWEIDGSLVKCDLGYIFEAYLPYDEPKAEARAEVAANLRLVTAAPDMLELLKSFFTIADDSGCFYGWNGDRNAIADLVKKTEALLHYVKGKRESE